MPPDQPRRMAEENKEDEKKTSQEERIAALEAALAASRGAAPLNPIPAHGAGEGDEIAESWSLYDQEQARMKKL